MGRMFYWCGVNRPIFTLLVSPRTQLDHLVMYLGDMNFSSTGRTTIVSTTQPNSSSGRARTSFTDTIFTGRTLAGYFQLPLSPGTQRQPLSRARSPSRIGRGMILNLIVWRLGRSCGAPFTRRIALGVDVVRDTALRRKKGNRLSLNLHSPTRHHGTKHLWTHG